MGGGSSIGAWTRSARRFQIEVLCGVFAAPDIGISEFTDSASLDEDSSLSLSERTWAFGLIVAFFRRSF